MSPFLVIGDVIQRFYATKMNTIKASYGEYRSVP